MNIKLSACTITKNEEKNIARSIDSYKKYVDEIVIVDTGSTDNTVEIAKSLGAKVLEYQWNNDFASARNFAIDNTTGDWILFLDADEWIADDGAKNIRKAIELAVSNKYDAVSCRMINLSEEGNVVETMSILRLFAKKQNIRYKRKIHELLYDFDKKQALTSAYMEYFSINHSGYVKSISKGKISRNRKLLEDIYAKGEAEPLDYFYLARENLTDNPERADYFLNLLVNSEDYMRSLNDINIGNNIHELKVKLSNILADKYSLEQRLAFIEDALKENSNDPLYYYYKYVVYSGIDNTKYKELLEKALVLDEDYEAKAKDKNNAFYKHKMEALYELAVCKLKEGDNVKALDYLVEIISNSEKNGNVLRLLLSVISKQSSQEIIAFIDSLFKTSEKEDLKFIIESLRISEYKDVFLYYFVKFYKLFGELDISFFTSRMLTGNYKEMFDKYLELFHDTKKEKALILMSAALVAGNLKDDYSNIKGELPFEYKMVLSAIFEENKCNFNEKTKDIFAYIFAEISYVLSDELLFNLADSFNNKEEVRKFIIDYYFNNFSYQKVIDFCSSFINEDLSDSLGGKVTAVLGCSYFRLGDFVSATGMLEQAISIGYLNDFVKVAYEKLISVNSVNAISEFESFKESLYRFNVATKFLKSKLTDCSGVSFANNIQDLENQINSKLNILDYFAETLLKFAKKNLQANNIKLAEEYYKLLLRCNYKIDIVLYDLAKIYDAAQKHELSFYCYQKALINNFALASDILSENSINKNYLYSNVSENRIEKCPICGENNSENSKTVCYLEAKERLSDNSPIVLYKYCKKCNHLFAENYRNSKEKIKKDVSSEYIFNAYDIIEKMSDKVVDKVLVIDDREELIKVIKENYSNVEGISESLMKVINLNEFIKKIKKYAEGNTYFITMLSDYSYPFDKEYEVGTINYFSKNSIINLLNKYEFSDIQIYNSKYILNKMIIIAKV